MKINEIIRQLPPVESLFQDLEKFCEVKWKSREKLVKIPIDLFLNLSQDFSPSEVKLKTVKSVLDSEQKFEDVPFLYFDIDHGVAKITGHEGRHRALVLKSVGYNYLPVLLKGPIRWSEQNNKEKFDYVQNWPIKVVGETGKTYPFLVSREDSEKPYHELSETKIVWKRNGTKFSPKYKCHTGHRAGKIVDNPSKCGEFLDLNKSMKMKKTRAKTNQKSVRKIKRVKKVNPHSKLLKRLNK